MPILCSRSMVLCGPSNQTLSGKDKTRGTRIVDFDHETTLSPGREDVTGTSLPENFSQNIFVGVN
jgi:hypothetical protein